MAAVPKPNELIKISHLPPKTGWMDTPVEFRKGNFSYPAKKKSLDVVGMPYGRDWSPMDEDWKLPDNWKQIVMVGLREPLEKFRSLRLFMDICVRCGAFADKCHFFIGSGDPKVGKTIGWALPVGQDIDELIRICDPWLRDTATTGATGEDRVKRSNRQLCRQSE